MTQEEMVSELRFKLRHSLHCTCVPDISVLEVDEGWFTEVLHASSCPRLAEVEA